MCIWSFYWVIWGDLLERRAKERSSVSMHTVTLNTVSDDSK